MAAWDENAVIGRTRRKGAAARNGKGIKLQKTITVNRPISEVFSFWRHLENLPMFMKHLESVKSNGGNISHWVAQIGGIKLEWDAEAIEVRHDELIAWKSLPTAELNNTGSIRFRPAPGNRGTVVKVALKYAPRAGAGSNKILKALGRDTASAIEEDLDRFKTLMDDGKPPGTNGKLKPRQGRPGCSPG